MRIPSSLFTGLSIEGLICFSGRWALAAVARAGEHVPQIEILQVCGAPRARLPLYMNAADVLLLASLAEGSPVAVKEAMATNLPVITVGVGDTAELIGPAPRTGEPRLAGASNFAAALAKHAQRG